MSSKLRSNRTTIESPPRRERVVISMKNVKPVTQELHRRLKADARDPKKTAGRFFPKI